MKRKHTKILDEGFCNRCGYKTATLSVSMCPSCGGPVVARPKNPRRRRIGFLTLPQMLFPGHYKWFVLVSALDLVLTWFILLLGGKEVNLVADAVISSGGLSGLILFKFSLVVFVVLLCEFVGRRRLGRGKNLARSAIAITAMPVILSIAQLFQA